MLDAALKNRDPSLRVQAAQSLGLIGRHWHGNRPSEQTFPACAVAVLAGALKDRDPRVRTAAVRAIGRIGAHAASASPDLAPLLRDRDSGIRLAALRVLPALGNQAMSPQAELVACLKDADRRVRLAAAEAVREHDFQFDAVVNGLLSALNDSDADVRAQASFKLALTNAKNGICVSEGSYYQADVSSERLAGAPASGAILRKSLIDPDRRVRAAAAYTLPVFKGEAAASIPVLLPRLKDPSPVVRVAAASALGKYGPAARAALAPLFAALEDPGTLQVNNISVSNRAALAIRSISPEDSGALYDRLLAMLADSRQPVRETAAATLTTLKTSDSPRLFDSLADPKTSRAVTTHLLAILAGENPGEAVPAGSEARAGHSGAATTCRRR